MNSAVSVPFPYNNGEGIAVQICFVANTGNVLCGIDGFIGDQGGFKNIRIAGSVCIVFQRRQDGIINFLLAGNGVFAKGIDCRKRDVVASIAYNFYTLLVVGGYQRGDIKVLGQSGYGQCHRCFGYREGKGFICSQSAVFQQNSSPRQFTVQIKCFRPSGGAAVVIVMECWVGDGEEPIPDGRFICMQRGDGIATIGDIDPNPVHTGTVTAIGILCNGKMGGREEVTVFCFYCCPIIIK